MGDFNAAIEQALKSPQDMDAYLEVRSAQEVIDDILALKRPEPDRSEARLRRNLDQYAGCSPEAISKGSEAQMFHFVADAKHDIAILAAGLVPDEAKIRDATSEMLLAGARSIGNTMGKPNFMQRAKACWEAMWNAREGVMENKPAAAIRNTAGRNAT